MEDIAVGENTSPRHPPCDVGCTPSMLGLLNSGPSHDLQTTLKARELELDEHPMLLFR